MKQALAWLARFVRRIPGFRHMSSSSMLLAGTWYGVALFTMAKYWYWGLAMLALPFLVFYLIDRDVMKNRRLNRVVAAAAGCLVLLGAALGLLFGGTAPQAAPTPQVFTAAPAASAVSIVPHTSIPATATATVIATRTAEPAASATPDNSGGLAAVSLQSAGPEDGQFAFVASKNSKVFHKPGCASAKRIKPANLVGFETRAEALDAGLRPCKQCKP